MADLMGERVFLRAVNGLYEFLSLVRAPDRLPEIFEAAAVLDAERRGDVFQAFPEAFIRVFGDSLHRRPVDGPDGVGYFGPARGRFAGARIDEDREALPDPLFERLVRHH